MADTTLLFPVGAGGMNCPVTRSVKPSLCVISPRWRTRAHGVNFSGLEYVFTFFFGATDHLEINIFLCWVKFKTTLQGTQFTPVGKEETSVRANWIALPLQQALAFLLVERRPLENQESGSPVFLGTLAFRRSAGFQRQSSCFLSMQSVCRMSSLLFLWQLQQSSLRLFKLPTEGGHWGWDDGRGPQGGRHDPPLKEPIIWWFYRYLPLDYGGLSNQ